MSMTFEKKEDSKNCIGERQVVKRLEECVCNDNFFSRCCALCKRLKLTFFDDQISENQDGCVTREDAITAVRLMVVDRQSHALEDEECSAQDLNSSHIALRRTIISFRRDRQNSDIKSDRSIEVKNAENEAAASGNNESENIC